MLGDESKVLHISISSIASRALHTTRHDTLSERSNLLCIHSVRNVVFMAALAPGLKQLLESTVEF